MPPPNRKRCCSLAPCAEYDYERSGVELGAAAPDASGEREPYQPSWGNYGAVWYGGPGALHPQTGVKGRGSERGGSRRAAGVWPCVFPTAGSEGVSSGLGGQFATAGGQARVAARQRIRLHLRAPSFAAQRRPICVPIRAAHTNCLLTPTHPPTHPPPLPPFHSGNDSGGECGVQISRRFIMPDVSDLGYWSRNLNASAADSLAAAAAAAAAAGGGGANAAARRNPTLGPNAAAFLRRVAAAEEQQQQEAEVQQPVDRQLQAAAVGEQPVASNPPFWFSYSHGSVHFVVISTEHDLRPGSKQHRVSWTDSSARLVGGRASRLGSAAAGKTCLRCRCKPCTPCFPPPSSVAGAGPVPRGPLHHPLGHRGHAPPHVRGIPPQKQPHRGRPPQVRRVPLPAALLLPALLLTVLLLTVLLPCTSGIPTRVVGDRPPRMCRRVGGSLLAVQLLLATAAAADDAVVAAVGLRATS